MVSHDRRAVHHVLQLRVLRGLLGINTAKQIDVIHTGFASGGIETQRDPRRVLRGAEGDLLVGPIRRIGHDTGGDLNITRRTTGAIRLILKDKRNQLAGCKRLVTQLIGRGRLHLNEIVCVRLHSSQCIRCRQAHPAPIGAIDRLVLGRNRRTLRHQQPTDRQSQTVDLLKVAVLNRRGTLGNAQHTKAGEQHNRRRQKSDNLSAGEHRCFLRILQHNHSFFCYQTRHLRISGRLLVGVCTVTYARFGIITNNIGFNYEKTGETTYETGFIHYTTCLPICQPFRQDFHLKLLKIFNDKPIYI